MPPTELDSTTIQTVWDFATIVYRWCVSHLLLFLGCVIVVLCLLMGVSLYEQLCQKEICILTGTGGTSSSNSADRIAHKLTQISRYPGIHFTARVEQTNGLDDIERRVGSDGKGQLIGYYINCRKNVDELKTLLPLDHELLHIFCRVEFLKKWGIKPHPSPDESAGHHSYEFGDLVEHLHQEPCRVFAGPAGSSTRYVAAQVFALSEVEGPRFEQLLNPAIRDWNEGRAALGNGTIDVMFFMGPKDTDTVRHLLAHNPRVVLVGITDCQAALAEDEDYSLFRAHFPANVYSVPPIPSSEHSGEGSEETYFHFCSGTLQTIATRRVMVCSPSMKPRDAYEIGQAVKSALGSDSPFVGNWDAAKVPELITASAAEHDLGLNPHEGAEWLKNRPDFWNFATWSPAWTPAVSSVALFLFAVGVQYLNERSAAGSRGTKPASVGGGDAGETFDSRMKRYEKQLWTLERRVDPMERDEWNREKEELQREHRAICELMKQDGLDQHDAEVVFAALRNIQDELDFFEPAKQNLPLRQLTIPAGH